MNWKNEVKRRAEVELAFVGGAGIEYFTYDYPESVWHSVGSPSFDWTKHNYRVDKKIVGSFEISGDGSLSWARRKLVYEWYKIYHKVGKKEDETYYVVHDGLLTEEEAEHCFRGSKVEYGKTGRFYEPNTKTFHSFEKSPSITRIP